MSRFSKEIQTAGSDQSQSAFEFGEFRVNAFERLLTRGGAPVALPPKTFEALLLLIRNAGRLLKKSTMLAALWPDTFVEEANLTNTISQLRRALGNSAAIETVPKHGYRFTAEVRLIGQSAPALLPPKARVPTRFIALPFRVLRPDPEIDFLAFSLPEAVSNSLSESRSLVIRSSLVAARYPPEYGDFRKIAAETAVDVVLTGSVLRDDRFLRISVQLVQALDGTLLWSHSARSKMKDIFQLQDVLARGIVESLMLSLTEREADALGRDVPANPAAYELYLRANQLTLEKRGVAMLQARDLYLQSVATDPGYAPAWARLGRCYRWLQKFGPDRTSDLSLPEAAFRRAFSLNPESSLAHNLYTLIEADLGRAQAAMVRLLGRASLSRNEAEVYAGLVQACRYCGLLNESAAAHHRAKELDPNVATSVTHTWFLMGDYDRCIASYDGGHYLDAAALTLLGRCQEAAERLRSRDLAPTSSDPVHSLMRSLLAIVEGRDDAAFNVIEEALSVPFRDPEATLLCARHLAILGKRARALELLARAAVEGHRCPFPLLHDPWLEPLRSEPELQRLVALARDSEAAARRVYNDAGGPELLASVYPDPWKNGT